MVEREVTRQLSVLVTPMFYWIFLLMYLHKIVCQNCWTHCDVHLLRKADKGLQLRFGLALSLRVRVLC